MKQPLLIVILFIYCSIYAQSTDWSWSKGAGGISNEYTKSLATDPADNLIAVGYFGSTSISFGSIKLNNISQNNDDIFISKHDPSGNVLWARSEGGRESDAALAVSTDSKGNAYVGGYFKSGSITFGTTTLFNADPFLGDLFLVKYDSEGNVVWARGAKNNKLHDVITAVTVDKSDNIYVTGHFQSGSITFDNFTLYNNAFPYQDIFVVKYNKDGDVLWAKRAGGNSNDIPNAITADPLENVIICGQFASYEVDFGSDVLYNFNGGFNDMFIAKYDKDGNAIWAKSAGQEEGDFALAVSTDQYGNAYAGGYFRSGNIYFDNYELQNPGTTFGNLFLVKYNNEGDVLWAKTSTNSESSDAIVALSLDAQGHIYATGHFQSYSIKFGSTVLYNKAEPNQDVYVAKYDTNGNPLWATSTGGNYHEIGTCIAVDNFSSVYIGGHFASTNLPFKSTLLTNENPFNTDLFIAKLGSANAIKEYAIPTAAIYPNPFSTNTTIETNIELTDATITLYNHMGQMVRTYKNASGTSFQINRDGLNAGSYSITYHKNGKLLGIGKVKVID